jgi:hypothetical protein
MIWMPVMQWVNLNNAPITIPLLIVILLVQFQHKKNANLKQGSDHRHFTISTAFWILSVI